MKEVRVLQQPQWSALVMRGPSHKIRFRLVVLSGDGEQSTTRGRRRSQHNVLAVTLELSINIRANTGLSVVVIGLWRTIHTGPTPHHRAARQAFAQLLAGVEHDLARLRASEGDGAAR